MNLSFSQVFPIDKELIGGTKTNFVGKILSNFGSMEIVPFYDRYVNNHLQTEDERMKLDDVIMNEPSKKHTIRGSVGRWKRGMKIHFQIWTGKPYKDPAFNFAPILLCSGTESIEIKRIENAEEERSEFTVKVNDRLLSVNEIEVLALNDGFNNSKDFFMYFDEDFTGEIIHWTGIRYDLNDIDVVHEEVSDHLVDALKYSTQKLKKKNEEN